MERGLVKRTNYLVDKGYDVTILVPNIGENEKLFFELDQRVKLKSLNLSIKYKPIGNRNILKLIHHKITENNECKKALHKFLTENPCDIFVSLINYSFIPRLKDGSIKIFESHMSVAEESFAEDEYKLSLLARLVYKFRRWIYTRNTIKYDRFVVLTESDRKLRNYPSNSLVIPNFIFITPPTNYAKLDNKQVLSLGRLAYQKGYDYLIDSWKLVSERHPDWVLRIYGGWQDCRGQYDEQIKSHNLEGKVIISEAVKDVTTVLLDSSIYVMSSRYEGFGNVLTEAMACGVPCVSYNCKCGPSDIITHREDGLLVENVGDIRGLANAICELIEDENRRVSYGKQAIKNVARYSPDRVMGMWIELFEELINNKRKS